MNEPLMELAKGILAWHLDHELHIGKYAALHAAETAFEQHSTDTASASSGYDIAADAYDHALREPRPDDNA